VNFYEGSTARSYGRNTYERESVVVIGSGGREHALSWKLAQSKQVRKVYVLPGNGGGGRKVSNVPGVRVSKADRFAELRAFCREKKVSLVVVGPEQPLVDGITDALVADGVMVFGPSKAAVILEESKAFSKDFMRRWEIPTAEYAIFRRTPECVVGDGLERIELDGYEAGLKYIEEHWPVVVKASGLAAGKGAIVPKSLEEAKDALTGMMKNGDFGAAAAEVVVEKMLGGRELSVLAISDGKTVKVLPLAQDHKRAFDNDEGPNTGGMGAFAPVTDVTADELAVIKEKCLMRCIDGMAAENRPFVGVLFAGLMIAPADLHDSGSSTTFADRVHVLEYNCRFGDPETQAVMPLIDGDMYQALVLCCKGKLEQVQLPVSKGFVASVVLASGGYPGSYEKNKHIDGLDKLKQMPSIWAFHAGTKQVKRDGSPTVHGGDVVTSGGRVLAVSALGRTLEHAVKLAYLGVEQVTFDDVFYRTDIARSALHPGGKMLNGGSPSDLQLLLPRTRSSGPGAGPKSAPAPLTYKAAGVDIAAGNATVEGIKPFLKGTARPGCEFGEELSFGGFCDLAKLKYVDPVLVSGTDGVGTKLLVAANCGKHSTVGIDLVAMCVNDCLVHGAEPVFFLDYFATGKLSVDQAVDVIKGVTVGCRQANCALIGGETAEMPGLYKPGEYDVAGFSVGIVERAKVLPRTSELVPGVRILGLASSGVHSNGLSLARKITTTTLNPHTAKPYSFLDPAPFDPNVSIGEYLLTPTKIYVKALLPLMQQGKVIAAAHITGGGLLENIPRVLPGDVNAVLRATAWPMPPILKWLFEAGALETNEMARTFNCGVGMVVFVNAEDVCEVMETIEAASCDVFHIGHLEPGTGEVDLLDTDLAWVAAAEASTSAEEREVVEQPEKIPFSGKFEAGGEPAADRQPLALHLLGAGDAGGAAPAGLHKDGATGSAPPAACVGA